MLDKRSLDFFIFALIVIVLTYCENLSGGDQESGASDWLSSRTWVTGWREV